ncbi:MAG: DUF1566 domain-containing protein [Syntrophaceae bacterium]|nr:DUF1566 domain-containing protein [Syntrophaceae bacterium]
MRRNIGKWIGIAFMAAMFCLPGLVMSGEAHAARFVNNNDGTVTDTVTGLMWADKDNGSPIDWSNAKRYCEGYSGGGKAGWRMPTIDELQQLYNSGTYGSAIRITGLAAWSSETNGSLAAIFRFDYGNWLMGSQSSSLYVRALPVRSGN